MKTSRAPAAVLLIAVVLRAAFAVAYVRHPVGAIVPLDTEPYRELARAAAAGELRDPRFDYLNPPYGFLLAPFVGFTPAVERALVIAVQIFLDAGTAALLYYVAAVILPRRTAVAAALVYALYGTAVFYCATLLPVTLSVFALMLTLAGVVFAADRPPRFAVLPGTALGFLSLVRPNALLLAGALVAWTFVRARRRLPRDHALRLGWQWAAWLVLGAALVLAPFALRALHVHGRLSPFPINGGINFYIGNNPNANGRYAHVDGVADRPGEQVVTSIAEASRRAGRDLTPAQASAYWFDAGLRWIAREPAAALALTLKKAAMFFRAEEATLNISYDFARSHVPLLRVLPAFGLLMPLAVWGAVSGLLGRPPHSRGLTALVCVVLGVYAASVVTFFVSDRYRMPIAPLVALLAAQGAFSLVAELRAGRASIPFAVVALAAVGVNYRFEALRFEEDGTDHVKLSDVYCTRGEYERALEECERAAAVAPEAPETSFCFANAYYFKKDPFRAEMALKATLERQAGRASDLPARKNLVWLYREQELFADALRESDDEATREHIRGELAAFQQRTGDLRAYAAAQLAWARTHASAGRLAEARYDLKRATSADPALDEAFYDLAIVAHRLQLSEEACAAIRHAGVLRPQFEEYEHRQAEICP